MNKIKNNLDNKNEVIFKDKGTILNKNNDWLATNGLIVDVNRAGTTLKMPDVGMYNYSPNIVLEGNFDLTMDILMPKGGSFLSFGFNDKQEEFINFKGWWNTKSFKKLKIRHVDGVVKYYLDNKFKGFIGVDSDKLYFQFRIYSRQNSFEFTFKNLQIVKLNLSKDSNAFLIEKINNLESQLNDVNLKFKNFEKNTNAILNSYHKYLDSIFVDHQLKPRKMLNSTQTLCLEILNFIDNVCKKYSLEYWLDAGNLLGAIRHEGYIPWDDDMDISMMRSDYEKLIKVIPFEIKNHNLEEVISLRYNFETKPNFISSFVQIVSTFDGLVFGCVDILPFDFLLYETNNFEGIYARERNNHFINLVNGVPREKVFKEVYKNLNLTYKKTDKMVMGVERGRPGEFRLILDSNKVFPLKYALFENRFYPCPNDSFYYLSSYFSNLLEIPKVAEFHSRQKYLKKYENTLEVYEKHISLLKKANERFKI